MSFPWNVQQLSAQKNIVEFVTRKRMVNDPEWALVVRGYAGTGKTTMVQEALRQCVEVLPKLRICVTAPTNKATQVLKNFGKSAGINVSSSTIYSLLGMILGNDGETRNCFSGGSGGSIAHYDVVVVDEASMVGRVLYDELRTQALRLGILVIFMGDDCQLNPVKESASNVFDTSLHPDNNTLTKVERQDEDSPIRKVVAAARLLVSEGVVPKPFETETLDDGSGVHILIGREFTDAMLDQFEDEGYLKNPQLCRALAWTNREVDRLNRIIRNRIYGKKVKQYMVGETIAVLGPVYQDDGTPSIFTDDECVIIEAAITTIADESDNDTYEEGHPEYKVWILTVSTPQGKLEHVITAHDDSKQALSNRSRKLADKASAKKISWGMFWKFQEWLTPVRPCHAMTIHKSQGQTFDCVFFQGKDSQNNKNSLERRRQSYVGLSRPRTDLVMNIRQIR